MSGFAAMAHDVQKRIRDLGLPPGCIIVAIGRRGPEKSYPRGSSRLEAGDRLTVVVSPEAAHASSLLIY